MASFSRLQLAAALIEYDNDPADPSKPFLSAHDSAIFAHLRTMGPPPSARKSPDYLGVNIPGSSGSGGGRESALSHNRARSSLDALRNPFGADPSGEEEGLIEEEPAEDLEVDLASWGLDSFIPKEKGSKNAKKKEKLVLSNPHSTLQANAYHTARSISMGNLDSFGAGGAFLDSDPSGAGETRRRSLGDMLDINQPSPVRPPTRPRSASAHALIDTLPVTPPLHSVPFPSQSIRSVSPSPNDEAGLRPGSQARDRRYSSASMGSRGLLNDVEENPNPFALKPPDPSNVSRFDPKMHARTLSMGTMGSLAAQDNAFSLRPPSRSSPFDPKAISHARTTSNASMGSRMMLDNDDASYFGGGPQRRERPYSTLELMRPKVLVMPSPLQGANTQAPAPAGARDGFELSTDGPPLPAAARSTRHLSSTPLLTGITAPASAVPIPSNSFTPNPRASLTLSQLTFRNSLMVDGQRDVAYTDIDARLRRATEEGEQIEESPDEEPVRPVTVVVDEPDTPGRPVGKLYGKSLVDELEARKATMRGKQRVFTGDDRPSMMARHPMKRSSTLIDPADLIQHPAAAQMGPPNARPPLGRRASTGAKPLLEFGNNGLLAPGTPGTQGTQRSPGMGPSTRSVFGVDTLWEREMAKLHELEAKEAVERKKEEEAEAAKLARKMNKKRKGKEKAAAEEAPVLDLPRTSAEPPVLPDIPKGITRGPPPPVNDDDTESDSDSTDVGAPATPAAERKSGETAATERWFAGSSDDGHEGPVRTTGVGPRYPKRGRGNSLGRQVADDDSSEEDVPLAATVDRAIQRATRMGVPAPLDSDSDEEKPLSTLLEKKLSHGVPSVNFDKLSASLGPIQGLSAGDDEDDEDNQPLGLRASRFVPAQSQSGEDGGDEDDRPLAFHPEQQRRTQYQMMLQQQQAQQQQMMMQAQMQTSMMFSNASMMGSGFFGPPMAPPMMMPMPPPMPGSPPPGAPDTAKFGRVDRWRRDVAVEGPPP